MRRLVGAVGAAGAAARACLPVLPCPAPACPPCPSCPRNPRMSSLRHAAGNTGPAQLRDVDVVLLRNLADQGRRSLADGALGRLRACLKAAPSADGSRSAPDGRSSVADVGRGRSSDGPWRSRADVAMAGLLTALRSASIRLRRRLRRGTRRCSRRLGWPLGPVAGCGVSRRWAGGASPATRSLLRSRRRPC